jgi:hypothetical protein
MSRHLNKRTIVTTLVGIVQRVAVQPIVASRALGLLLRRLSGLGLPRRHLCLSEARMRVFSKVCMSNCAFSRGWDDQDAGGRVVDAVLGTVLMLASAP